LHFFFFFFFPFIHENIYKKQCVMSGVPDKKGTKVYRNNQSMANTYCGIRKVCERKGLRIQFNHFEDFLKECMIVIKSTITESEWPKYTSEGGIINCEASLIDENNGLVSGNISLKPHVRKWIHTAQAGHGPGTQAAPLCEQENEEVDHGGDFLYLKNPAHLLNIVYSTNTTYTRMSFNSTQSELEYYAKHIVDQQKQFFKSDRIDMIKSTPTSSSDLIECDPRKIHFFQELETSLQRELDNCAQNCT